MPKVFFGPLDRPGIDTGQLYSNRLMIACAPSASGSIGRPGRIRFPGKPVVAVAPPA
jgi:hypothetical protein